MKKFMLAVLAGAMVFSFASQALAEVTIGGSIETRYDYWNKLALTNDDDGNFILNPSFGAVPVNESKNFFDSRIMLNVDAKITDGLEAFIELDSERAPRFDSALINYINQIEGQPFGDTIKTERWGRDTDVINLPWYLNHSGNQMSIRQAWVNFMVPGLPVGVKIGHQPLALGHGIWLDTHRYGSDAILLYSKPIPELLVAAAYVKGSESFSPLARNDAGVWWGNQDVYNNNAFFGANSNSDADFYAILANYTWMENNTAGINFTYVDDKGTLPWDIWATNVGLTADGTIAGLTYKAEADWLHVNVKDFWSVDSDYMVNAFAALLGASYNVMDMANVGLEAGFGTGNHAGDANFFYQPNYPSLFSGPANMAHDHAYFTPYLSGSYNYAFLYNDKIGQGIQGAGGGFGFGDGYGGFGLANTFYVKLSAEVSPIERLKAGLDVLYLRAHHKQVADQSHSLGWEIDAHASYALYDNLDLDVNGGYFITGNWYKYGAADAPHKNAYGLETKLTVKF